MKKIKNQKGITLVTLVVTIIILIILAGVSINAIIGENGIITLAKKAKENAELSVIYEQEELNELYEQMEINGTNPSDNNSGLLSYNLIAKYESLKKDFDDFKKEAATKDDINDLSDELSKKVHMPEYKSSTKIFEDSNYNSNAKTWTADEDCWVYITIYHNGYYSYSIQINGINIGYYYCNDSSALNTLDSYFYPIKKGDVLDILPNDLINYSGTYFVRIYKIL